MIILDEEEQRSSDVPLVLQNPKKTDTPPSSSGINNTPTAPPPPYTGISPTQSPSSPYFHQTAHHPHHHHQHPPPHPHHSQQTTPTHPPTTVAHTGTTAVEDHPLIAHFRTQEQELEKRTLKRFFGAFLIALMIVTLSGTFVQVVAGIARSGRRHGIHVSVQGEEEVIGMSEVVLPSRTSLESATPIPKERVLSIAYPPH